jgi:hypothetical protein
MPHALLSISATLRRVGLTGLVLLVVFAALHAQSAHAQAVADPDFWKQTAERQDTVNRFFYRQSPQAIPSSYDPVLEAEEILRQHQATLSPSNAKAPGLWRQIRGVTVKSALSTPPRALGAISLAAGSFELGWKIGSFANAKWLRIGLPDPPHPKANPAEGMLIFKNAGFNSPTNTTPLPADGWLLRWNYGSSQWTSVNLSHGWADGCAYLTEPPADFNVLPGVSSVPWCEQPPVSVESYWLEENQLAAPGPIEDYTDQPYTRSDPAPTPPPRSTVEQSIENELEQSETSLLRQWLNYQLGSPGETDPLGIDEPNPDIEFIELDRHFTDHGQKFSPAYTDPWTYWRDAADIFRRGQDGPNRDSAILRCRRLGEDPAEIYWDTDRHAWVIVKDGKIVTYYPPDGGFDAFIDQCDEFF